MRAIVFTIIGFLLIAGLVGISNPDGSLSVPHVDSVQTATLMSDTLCAEVLGHGTCQPIVMEPVLVLAFMAPTASFDFEIASIVGTSRVFAPHTPPPRRVF